MGFPSEKTLGVSLTSVDSTQVHELGIEVEDNAGAEFTYVKADATGVAAGDAVKLTTATWIVASATAGTPVFGVAPLAIAANYYGWVQTSGIITNAKVAAGTASLTLVSLLAAASAKLTAVVAVNESGATAHVAGAQTVRGMLLTAEASGTATVRLYEH